MTNKESATDPKAAMTKVLFRLEVEDGYPPVPVESLWAEELPDGTFRLKNIPFYAQLVSYDDVVTVKAENGERFFEKVVRPSGHSTLRVILADQAHAAELQRGLERLGCGWEGSNVPSLIAVDVPPAVALDPVQDFLAEGEDDEKWEYEESALQHPEE